MERSLFHANFSNTVKTLKKRDTSSEREIENTAGFIAIFICSDNFFAKNRFFIHPFSRLVKL